MIMWKRSVFLGGLLALALSAPADAFMSCRAWNGLDDGQRRDALLAEIDRIVSSNDARKYGSINKVNVRHCLEGRISRMADDFDALCMDKKTASMQALTRELDRYIWTCVGGRDR